MPHIVDSQGHIVVVSSAYAFVNGVGSAAYAMTKAAVEQLGRALRLELTPHRVGVTVAYFGIVNTDLVKDTVDGDPLTVDLFALVPKVRPLHVPSNAELLGSMCPPDGRRSRSCAERLPYSAMPRWPVIQRSND